MCEVILGIVTVYSRVLIFSARTSENILMIFTKHHDVPGILS